MTTLLAIALPRALVYGLAAVVVRAQLSLLDGFDFTVATLVLIAAETFVWTANIAAGLVGPIPAILVGLGASGIVAVAGAVGWSRLGAGLFGVGEGNRLLVVSLGGYVAASGAIVALRGPGVASYSFVGTHSISFAGLGLGSGSIFGLLGGAAAVVGVLWWRGSRSALGLELLSDDREFAEEIGVTPTRIALGTGVVGGVLLTVVGCYYAMIGGSTPDVGLAPFLFGAAGALLYGSATLRAALLGGMTLGLADVAVQLFIDPAMSSLVLFGAVLIFLVVRGSPRQALRGS